jgi:hypothetical protein
MRAAVHKVRGPDLSAGTQLPELFHRWVRGTQNQWFTMWCAETLREPVEALAAGCFRNRTPPPRVMSVDVGEDSVELVEAVVADHELAFAAG